MAKGSVRLVTASSLSIEIVVLSALMSSQLIDSVRVVRTSCSGRADDVACARYGGGGTNHPFSHENAPPSISLGPSLKLRSDYEQECMAPCGSETLPTVMGSIQCESCVACRLRSLKRIVSRGIKRFNGRSVGRYSARGLVSGRRLTCTKA
jgi:hypothetical protein